MNETQKAEKQGKSDNSALLCCPFCGGDAGVGRCSQGKGFYFVNCTECNASTDQLSYWPFTKEEAVENWNRRAT